MLMNHNLYRSFWKFAVICFLSLSVCPVYASSPKRAHVPISTTLCAIVQNPRLFDRKLVTFKAQYDMPGLEGSWLNDQGCSDVNIAADVLDDAKSGDVLRNAYQTGILGTSDKTITATWVGIFRWQPKQAPKRILYVREIKDLTVASK